MKTKELTINGYEIHSTNSGYFAKDLIDDCPFYYSQNFLKVKERVEGITSPMRSMFWDANKFDKKGNQKHTKISLL